MDNKQKELSLKFYSFLCDIIGSKDVVNKRRQIYAAIDDQSLDRHVFKLSSGSRAEGLDLQGSDFDDMMVSKVLKVFERLDQIKGIEKNVSIIMETKNVKPGFAKLLIHHLHSNELIRDCIDSRTGLPYLSSTFFREMHWHTILETDPSSYMHGPCATSSEGKIDHALSLYCSHWISQAFPWINRSKFSWASNEVIQNILNFGVLFVPIGCKNSPYTELEWRISFSYAEKQLIFCFNHVQLLCYALLKIMLRDIIKKTFGDLLCSYFLKTIMFWLCEETDLSFWKAENILSCFMACFRRLIYCVENKSCLHYFIPENDLFEHRFEKQHGRLLSTLYELYDSGWKCLLSTETLQSFRNFLESSISLDRPFSTFLPCLRIIDSHIYDHDDKAALMKRLLYNNVRYKKERDLHILLISSLCQCLALQNPDGELVQDDNKLIYMNFRRRASYLLIGLNHDAVTGWLLLASFFFTNEQYSICKILIDHCFTKFTPERCELYCSNNFLVQRVFIENRKVIGSRCLKSYILNMIKIRGYSSIFPTEMKHIVEHYSLIFMPSLAYAHFLNFLFYHAIGDDRAKSKSYRNLVLTGQHEYVFQDRIHITNVCICRHIAADLMNFESYNK